MEKKSTGIRFGKTFILNTNYRFGLIILMVFLTFNSCKSRKKLASTDYTGNINHANYTKIFDTIYPDWNHFQSKVKISFNDGLNPISGNASIRMQQDSLIWVSVSFMGGFEVARILITQDSAVVLDKFNHIATILSKENLSSYTGGYDFNISELQGLILGKLILNTFSYKWYDGETEKNFYLKGRKDSMEFTHHFAKEKIEPLALTVRNLSNTDKAFVEYSNMTLTSLFSIPGFIKITSQPEGVLNPVQIELNMLSPGFINEQTYPFVIPKSYEIRRN